MTDDPIGMPANQSSLPVFIHLTKAAGHTVRALLQANYASPYVDNVIRGRVSPNGLARAPSSNDQDIAFMVADVMARQHQLSFVASNLAYGIHKYLHRPVRYFSFVREPIARCISYWYFAYRERDSNPAWRMFERNKFDLEQILQGTSALQLTDHQIRTLLGSTDIRMTESHLERATAHISENYVIVGATERFDDCLPLLREEFGWRTTKYVARHVGDKSDSNLLPANAGDMFADANQFDARLHQWILTEYLPVRLALYEPLADLGSQS